ncbi:MAG TPA: hypothetical protein VNL35_16675 [Chloroflexota bacterium]|nr:hypothetical protein [Chloroflexota bacterium]
MGDEKEIDFDALIDLAEAAKVAGLSTATMRLYVATGKLKTVTQGRSIRRPNEEGKHARGVSHTPQHFTTRRWLHEYLMTRKPRFGVPPKLPEGYVVPGSSPERKNTPQETDEATEKEQS